MRVHTKLSLDDIRKLQRPSGVHFEYLTERGSRSRDRAFEIVLTGSSAHRGQSGDRDYAAATWDEWGVFLGALFAADPNARVAGIYEGRDDYDWQTGERFLPDDLPETLCKRHRWESGGYGSFESECKRCGAVRRWRV